MSETVPTAWLVYCRPGFENDALAEMQHHANEQEVACLAERGDGWATLTRTDGEPINQLHREAGFKRLIFARQSLAALPALSLSRDDRLTPILTQIKASGWSFEEIWHESPDTNEGKALAGLIKALTRPLESMLKKPIGWVLCVCVENTRPGPINQDSQAPPGIPGGAFL